MGSLHPLLFGCSKKNKKDVEKNSYLQKLDIVEDVIFLSDSE